ncbi:MAG: Rieske (2Fe-2S) protein [Methanobacteriota archaeon]|nr:MAG: Rieske (2Fe-2S) protein [Euryarchaeota archaeon]
MDWKFFASVDEIGEGEELAKDIEGEAILLVNVGGDYYAISNICSHMQCKLSKGSLEGFNAVCPCHNAAFNIRDGSVVRPPASGTPIAAVESYEVKVEDGKIFVKI